MIWTILALLCVVATKFLTAVRLRGLKARLEATQPRVDELRRQLAAAEEEAEALRLEVTRKSQLLNAVQDKVRGLEASLQQPTEDLATLERAQLMDAVAHQEDRT